MRKTEEFIIDLSSFLCGTPLLVLLLGGGLFFLFYSKLTPVRYIGHAIDILRGKYDDTSEKGEISHYQALQAI